MLSKRKVADRETSAKKAKQQTLSSPFTPVSEQGDPKITTVATRGRSRGRGKGGKTGRGRGRPRKSTGTINTSSTQLTDSNVNFDSLPNQTSPTSSSVNTHTAGEDDASSSSDGITRSVLNCPSRSSVNSDDSLAPVIPLRAAVENGILPTSASSFLPPTLAIAPSTFVHNSSSSRQSGIGTQSLLSFIPPELLQQLSSAIMQFSSSSLLPAASTQSKNPQNSSETVLFDDEHLTGEIHAEVEPSIADTQIREDENSVNQATDNVDLDVNEDFIEPNQSLQNETSGESVPNSSNVNRIVRRRDIRFEQVKASATQHSLTARVFRNQLSSYNVTSAKMKYNLNLNMELRPFPKTRMLSPGEHPRKDNDGRSIEAFELPNLDHILDIKVYGAVTSTFVAGKKSDPVIKEVSQSVYSKLFPYTGYYPCSTFIANFTTVLVERYCGLHDEQSATGNTLIMNKIQQIYESARASRKNVLVSKGLLELFTLN